MIAQANCNQKLLLNLTTKCQPYSQTSHKCNLFNPNLIGIGVITTFCVIMEAICIFGFLYVIQALNQYNRFYEFPFDDQNNKRNENKEMKYKLKLFIGICFLLLIISSITYLSSFQYISNQACFDFNVDQNGCKVDLRAIREENPYPLCEEIIDFCVEQTMIDQCKYILVNKETIYNPSIYIPWNYTETVFDFKQFESKLIISIYPAMLFWSVIICGSVMTKLL